MVLCLAALCLVLVCLVMSQCRFVSVRHTEPLSVQRNLVVEFTKAGTITDEKYTLKSELVVNDGRSYYEVVMNQRR